MFTPVGGLSGETVSTCWKQVSILANIVALFCHLYIKDYQTIVECGHFCLLVMVLMMLLFYQILFPLGEMKWREMQLFAGRRPEHSDYQYIGG